MNVNNPTFSGTVYHVCGARFEVSTYTNAGSSTAARHLAADPCLQVVNRICHGCDRATSRAELMSAEELRRINPDIGKALRHFLKVYRTRQRQVEQRRRQLADQAAADPAGYYAAGDLHQAELWEM